MANPEGINGEKSTDIEVEQRVTEVLDLIVTGATRRQIVQYSTKTWNMQPRMVDEYIARARKVLIIENQETREESIQKAIARLERIIRNCYQEKNWSEIRACQDQINKILGTYAPTRNLNLEIDASKLTEQELDSKLDELTRLVGTHPSTTQGVQDPITGEEEARVSEGSAGEVA